MITLKMYRIDGSGLSNSDRLSIDQQLNLLGYVYNPVPPLCEFTFYAEDNERVSESLKLPDGCTLIEIS